MNHYQAYGELARSLRTDIIASGRHEFQAAQLSFTIDDIRSKLRLESRHRLLEVGCGVGLLLRPLAKFVNACVGIDHPGCVSRLRESGVPENVTLVEGEWPATYVDGDFDRILVYSVLHHLPNQAAAVAFIDGCVAALAPDGWLLVGDLPNADSVRRFKNSRSGVRIAASHDMKKQAAALHPEEQELVSIFSRYDPVESFISDEFLLSLATTLRTRGLEAYLVPQRPELPFGWSREDLLVWKRG